MIREVQEYKVLLIGDKGVGKTSFLLRIMSDKFVAAASSAEPSVDAYTKERVCLIFLLCFSENVSNLHSDDERAYCGWRSS